MPETICNHPSTITREEPDEYPGDGKYIITLCAVCLTELSRMHILGN